MSYIETIYSPEPIVEQGLTLCICWRYDRIACGVLCRDFAAQRCYEETI